MQACDTPNQNASAVYQFTPPHLSMENSQTWRARRLPDLFTNAGVHVRETRAESVDNFSVPFNLLFATL